MAIEKLNSALYYIEKKKISFFLGAGISRIAGCKDWNQVIDDMEKEEIIKTMIISGVDNNVKFSKYKKVFEEHNQTRIYESILMASLRHNTTDYETKYKPFFNKITTIDKDLKVITTNIDQCLEYTEYFPRNNLFYNECDFIFSNYKIRTVFYIHGHNTELSNSLWTEEQYKKRYRNQSFIDFVLNIISNSSVIFLGYALRDTEILEIFLKDNERKYEHFALVPNEEYDTRKASEYKDLYNINLIDYGNKNDFINIFSVWVANNLTLPERSASYGK